MKIKLFLAFLLAFVLVFSSALPTALAANAGNDAYVCTKATSQCSDGSSSVETTAYDKRGNAIETVLIVRDAEGAVTRNETVCSYDGAGNLTEEAQTLLTSDGRISSTVTAYVYDNTGHVVRCTYVSDSSEGESRNLLYTFAYDSQGRVIEEICEDSDGKREIWTNTFDERGNKTQETYANGEESKSTVSSYNQNGLLIKTVTTDCSADGVWKSVSRYHYDGNGNLIKETCLNKSSSGYRSNSVEKTAYDEKGNVTKKVFSCAGTDGNIGREVKTFCYDAAGKLTLETDRWVYPLTIGRRKTSYLYNDRGDLIKKADLCFGTDGLIGRGTTTFAYNENGDLVSSKESYRDVLGKHSASSVFDYYSAGQLKKEETSVQSDKYLFFFFGGYRSQVAESSVYDVDGNLLERIYFTQGIDDAGFRFSETNSYDKNGNVVESVCTVENEEGIVKTIKTFEYQKIGD